MIALRIFLAIFIIGIIADVVITFVKVIKDNKERGGGEVNDSITKTQLEEINEKYFYESREAGYALLKEYTGIEARPYTAYQFYDEAGNYVGDSENDDFEEIVRNAYIRII